MQVDSEITQHFWYETVVVYGVQATIDIMYGSKESISVKECRKFKEFFKLLQVDFAEETEDERVSLKRGNMEDLGDGLVG